MQLVLALACDHAEVRPDGKLDVQGIFNELNAPGFPAAQDSMTVVFVLEWERDETGTHELRADLMDQNDRMVLTIQGHTEVPERTLEQHPPQTRLILKLDRVIFPAAGSYRFRLRAGQQTLDALPIHVVERKQDPRR